MAFGGIDIGTSGCKCTLFNEKGTQLAVSYRPYTVTRERGHHEIDVMVIWSAVKTVIAEAANQTDEPVEALSVSSFGESFVMLDANDVPLFPVMLYTDSRGSAEAVELLEHRGGNHIFAITGHRPNSTYSMPKLMWLYKNVPDILQQTQYVLPVASCIMYFLSGERVTDPSLAARTMMLDINRMDWSPELLAVAGLTPGHMPKVVDIGAVAGTIRKPVADELGISKKARIVAGGHDQVVAAVGAGVLALGQAVNSSGSVECITPVFSIVQNPQKLYDSHFARIPMMEGFFATYATIFSGGVLLDWFVRNFGENTVTHEDLESQTDDHASGILVLPYFAGSASPYYDPEAKGTIVGLTLEHTAADVYKALQEGICYEAALNLELLTEAGITLDRLRIVGGGKHSRRWSQMKADVYGISCATLKTEEAGATGSAMLAGVALGRYKDLTQAASVLVTEDDVFVPRNGYTEEYRTHFEHYKKLYGATKEIMRVKE